MVSLLRSAVHAAARTRRWGAIEVLTLAVLPLFFAMAYILYARPAVPVESGIVVTLICVTPTYVLCGRAEEPLLPEAFGREHARYREGVGALGPRWRRVP